MNNIFEETADILREVYGLDVTTSGEAVIADGKRYEIDVTSHGTLLSIREGSRVQGGVFRSPYEMADMIYAMRRGHEQVDAHIRWMRTEDGRACHKRARERRWQR